MAKSIDTFRWNKKFSERSANDQVLAFNAKLLYIMSNFIPNKKMNFDDKDFDDQSLPMFDRKIENMIKDKNKVY